MYLFVFFCKKENNHFSGTKVVLPGVKVADFE